MSENCPPSIESFKNEKLTQILNIEIPRSINSFITNVSSNEFPYPVDEKLGDRSIENRDIVVGKLHFLSDFLGEYSQSPSAFDTRVTSYDKNNETYRINLGRGPRQPIDHHGEDQVSFIFRKPIITGHRDDDIYIASLSGKPPETVLDYITKQDKYSIQINSSHIYLDEGRRIRINPYAGIIFNFAKSGPSVFGLSFIGTNPAYTPLDSKPLNKDQFKTLRDFIITPNSR